MRLFDPLLTRRRGLLRSHALPLRVRRRLVLACRELADAEDAMAERLGLPATPRLLIVDEEEAVIVTPAERSGSE